MCLKFCRIFVKPLLCWKPTHVLVVAGSGVDALLVDPYPEGMTFLDSRLSR